MYEALSYLPQILLNQTFVSYVAEHLFLPLNMTSTTYSVAEAETSGYMAHGFAWDGQDSTLRDKPGETGKNGTRIPILPWIMRPGQEETLAGAGGVLSSARDMVRSKHRITLATKQNSQQ